MEILFLTYNSADSSSFYRSAGVAKDLRKKIGITHNITVVQWPDLVLNWSFINQFDLVMFQRPFSKDAMALCEFIKQCKIKLWVDWDDDLFHVTPENPAFSIYSNPEIQKSMRQIISIADAVTVSTENLRIILSSLNKNITVIPNAFNDTFFERGELSRRTNNIVWRGPEAHVRDLSVFSAPINKATEKYPDWRFIFMGFSPWFLNHSDNKGHIPSQDIISYFSNLFTMAPAAVHVPLHDNPFNRCRSNVAALEAGYAGAVAIVPQWWEMPGTIPYKDTDSYYEAMCSVLDGEVNVVVQNKIMWEYIMDELPLSKVNVKRLEVINSLL